MRGRTQRVQCFFALFFLERRADNKVWPATALRVYTLSPSPVRSTFWEPAGAALTPFTRPSPHSPVATSTSHMESLLELCCRRCTWRAPAAPRRRNSVGPITPKIIRKGIAPQHQKPRWSVCTNRKAAHRNCCIVRPITVQSRSVSASSVRHPELPSFFEVLWFLGLVDLGLPLPLPSMVSLFGPLFFQLLFVSEGVPLPKLELFATVRVTCLRPK